MFVHDTKRTTRLPSCGRPRLAPKRPREGPPGLRMRPFAACCVRCENRGRPCGPEAKIEQRFSWGNRRRRERRFGAATASEWWLVPTPMIDVVSSEMPAAPTGAPPRVSAEEPEVVRRVMRGGRDSGHGKSASANDRDGDRERRAKRARGRRCRRNTVDAKGNGPCRRRSDDTARGMVPVRLRPSSRGCRAASPCRRGSR